MSAFYLYRSLSLPSVNEQAIKKETRGLKRFHEQLNSWQSLSDRDTISEHLPIADIANRESILTREGRLSTLTHTAWQVHMCTPNKLYLFPFNI